MNFREFLLQENKVVHKVAVKNGEEVTIEKVKNGYEAFSIVKGKKESLNVTFNNEKEGIEWADSFINEAKKTAKVDGVIYNIEIANNGFITITSKGEEFTASPRGRVEFATINGKQLSMVDSEEYQDLVDRILGK